MAVRFLRQLCPAGSKEVSLETLLVARKQEKLEHASSTGGSGKSAVLCRHSLPLIGPSCWWRGFSSCSPERGCRKALPAKAGAFPRLSLLLVFCELSQCFLTGFSPLFVIASFLLLWHPNNYIKHSRACSLGLWMCLSISFLWSSIVLKNPAFGSLGFSLNRREA